MAVWKPNNERGGDEETVRPLGKDLRGRQSPTLDIYELQIAAVQIFLGSTLDPTLKRFDIVDASFDIVDTSFDIVDKSFDIVDTSFDIVDTGFVD